MPVPVLTAVTGRWEAPLVAGLERGGFGVQVVRRCADLAELLAAAQAGLARAAIVSGDLPRLDGEALARLHACAVAVVILAESADPVTLQRLRLLGVHDPLPSDASASSVAEAVLAVIEGQPAGPDRPGAPGRSGATGQPVGSGQQWAEGLPGVPGPTPAPGEPGAVGRSGTSWPVAPIAETSRPGTPRPGESRPGSGVGPTAGVPGWSTDRPAPTWSSPHSSSTGSGAVPPRAAGSGPPTGPGPVPPPGAGSAPLTGAAGSPPGSASSAPAGGPAAAAGAVRSSMPAPGGARPPDATRLPDVTRLPDATRPGRLVAVWGPTGAPGRTTVAVTLAVELALAGHRTLIADADTYGPSIAQTLALLDESAGLAAAVRAANQGTLDLQRLSVLAPAVQPGLRVLTGIPRPARWPELRPSGLQAVWQLARSLAAWTVVDCGFGLESDEEVSFDVAGPRRNGATLCTLAEADHVLVVGSADPIGLHRLVRGLQDLREVLPPGRPRHVVVTKVRESSVGSPAPRKVAEALTRYAGVRDAVLVPDDRPACDAAMLAGRSLAEVAPQSPARHALLQLAAELAAPAAGPTGENGRPVAMNGRRPGRSRGRGGVGRPGVAPAPDLSS